MTMTFKQVLSFFLAGTAAMSMTTAALAADVDQPAAVFYHDVADGAWYAPAIEYVSEHNLMLSDSVQMTKQYFDPDRAMSRQEVADALYRDAAMRGLAEDGGDAEAAIAGIPDFDKIAEIYYPAMAFCYEAGIMTGDSAGQLNPRSLITREEFAAVLARYDQLLLIHELEEKAGGTIVKVGFANWYEAQAEMEAFTDYDQIGAWAREEVTACLAHELMHGNADGTFNPKGDITRAEMAQVLYNFYLSLR